MTQFFSDAMTQLRQPRVLARIVLGLLLLANLVMAAVVFKPWAASAADLDRQVSSLRKQLRDRQAAIERLRALVSKIESARAEGDRFQGDYFMSRRAASSTIVDELQTLAQKAGIKPKEAAYVFEPVEGSETISMMSVTANYEGTFADLMQFINLLDRSPKFLILESLQAAPQQSGLTLSVSMKLNSFVRDEGEKGGAQ
jgi:type IV pilus assembly protein PilO